MLPANLLSVGLSDMSSKPASDWQGGDRCHLGYWKTVTKSP